MINHDRKTPYTRWLASLDKKLGKPDNSELMVVYWWAWTGKTEFTHFLARKNADNWVKICYISLEMPSHQLALRYALKKAGIKSFLEYQDKTYTPKQKELIDKYFKEFIEYENIFLVWEDREYSIQDLISEKIDMVGIMTQYYDMWCRLFVIDNLGKIQTNKNEWEAQGEISSKLQTWKNKYNCNVILIHHTGKSKNNDKASMRWSQKIMDNATRVIRLERDSDPDASLEDKLKLTIYQEKYSMWGNYEECECYFRKWDYVEKYFWTEDDELF